MKLMRVTMTGADESVKVTDLLALSEKYPFVEWGILASKMSAGRYRFPKQDWIETIPENTHKFSLHLCGSWVRQILYGNLYEFPTHLLNRFHRIQLNFHREVVEQNVEACAACIKQWPRKQWIFQIDGKKGTRYLFDLMGHFTATKQSMPDMVPLFDVSGGVGVSPKDWPKPWLEFDYHGYAGGIGEDNIIDELKRIDKVTKDDDSVWIDMETKVRSNDDLQFDLQKVENVLKVCQHYIYAPSTTTTRERGIWVQGVERNMGGRTWVEVLSEGGVWVPISPQAITKPYQSGSD